VLSALSIINHQPPPMAEAVPHYSHCDSHDFTRFVIASATTITGSTRTNECSMCELSTK
jgi:hypothetical protein